MAEPITWRNINSRSDAVGASLLNQAGQSMNNAITGLDKAVGNIQQNRKAEHQHLVDTNTQRFLDEVAKYRTVEDLQTAQSNGVFDRLRSELGSNVNADALRDVLPNTLQTLQQRNLSNQQYKDSVRQVNEREPRDMFGTLLAKGLFNDAENLLETNDLRNESELYSQLASSRRSAKDRDFAEAQRERQLNEQNRVDNERAKQKAFDKKLAEHLAGKPADVPATQWINQFKQDAYSSGEYSVAQVEGAGGILDNALLSSTQLSATDKNALQTTLTQLDTEYASEKAMFDMGPNYNPQQAAVDIVNRQTKFLDEFDADSKAGTVSKVMELLTKGVLTENGSRIPLPPALVEASIRTMDDGWVYDTDLEDTIAGMIELSGLADSYERFETYKTKRLTEQEKALKAVKPSN